MKNKNIIITGCSGFIGINLINFLILKKYCVYGLDRKINDEIKILKKNKNFYFKKIDLSKENQVLNYYKHIEKISFVSFWHLAANSDIAKGINDYKIEFNDTFLTTINSINLAKKLKVASFVFSSSSAIFGTFNKRINENSSPMRPISNYGSMKLASESYIYSLARYFKKIFIFRLPNVIGPKMTHGLLFDLKNKFEKNPKKINLLGNGNQKKPYLHVSKLIYYMFRIYNLKDNNNINVYNIGPNDDGIKVKTIAKLFKKIFNKSNAELIFEKKEQGWVGDVTKYRYDNTLICKTLKIKVPDSKDSIVQAIYEIKDN